MIDILVYLSAVDVKAEKREVYQQAYSIIAVNIESSRKFPLDKEK